METGTLRARSGAPDQREPTSAHGLGPRGGCARSLWRKHHKGNRYPSVYKLSYNLLLYIQPTRKSPLRPPRPPVTGRQAVKPSKEPSPLLHRLPPSASSPRVTGFLVPSLPPPSLSSRPDRSVNDLPPPPPCSTPRPSAPSTQYASGQPWSFARSSAHHRGSSRIVIVGMCSWGNS